VVLAVKVGKPRSFWRGFFLALGSLGVYGRYWDYRAHDEVYKQFELAREGREQGVAWYFMAYPLPVLKFVYYYHFVSNTLYLRTRMGYARSLSPGAFLGLSIPGTASFLLGFILFLTFLGAAAAEEDIYGRTVWDGDLVAAAFLSLGISIVVWLTLRGIAYYRLQSDLNGIWETFDSRSRVLRYGAQPQPAQPWAPPAPAGTWSSPADMQGGATAAPWPPR